jgi:hypothetical protein
MELVFSAPVTLSTSSQAGFPGIFARSNLVADRLVGGAVIVKPIRKSSEEQ